jgi:hypothetical protein
MLEKTKLVYKYRGYYSYKYQTGNFVEPVRHSMYVGIVIQENMSASAGAFDAQETDGHASASPTTDHGFHSVPATISKGIARIES